MEAEIDPSGDVTTSVCVPHSQKNTARYSDGENQATLFDIHDVYREYAYIYIYIYIYNI